ncbi:hypothetical protein SLS58_009620 [Diplodia intermedia]|uniref:Uncharacterized protein n=1 Tax=Diplodia intermedia TaxID=856260 RepID=A0ABR3TBU2_9PEZI
MSDDDFSGFIDWTEYDNDERPVYTPVDEQPAGELWVPDLMEFESTYQPINPERNYASAFEPFELDPSLDPPFESTYQPINPERNDAPAFPPTAFVIDPSLDPTFDSTYQPINPERNDASASEPFVFDPTSEPLDEVPEWYHDLRAFNDPSWEPAGVDHEPSFFNSWVEDPSSITLPHTPSPPPTPAIPIRRDGVPTTTTTSNTEEDECNARNFHARTRACKAVWDLLARATDPAPPRAHVEAARAAYFRARADEQNRLDGDSSSSSIRDDDGTVEAGIVVAHSRVWDWHMRRRLQRLRLQKEPKTVTFADDVQDAPGRPAEAFGQSGECYVPGRWEGDWLDTSGMKVPFGVFYADEMEDGSEDDSEDETEDDPKDEVEDEVDADADIESEIESKIESEVEPEVESEVEPEVEVKAKVKAKSKRLKAQKLSKKE